jgi:cytochrome c biogenesis protein CcdA
MENYKIMKKEKFKLIKKEKFFFLALSFFLLIILFTNLIFSINTTENITGDKSQNNLSLNNLSNNLTHEKNVYFFWGIGCPHCEKVISSGVLERAKLISNTNIYELEVYNNQTNRDLYEKYSSLLKIPSSQKGVPLLVIECDEGYSYFIGDSPIINNLEKSLEKCSPMIEIKQEGLSSDNPNAQSLTLGSIILSALIDSINPCAFGVLIFLLATLLSTASSKRALRYGLVYVLIIFLVYFSAGLGIMKIISEFSGIMNYIILIAGVLVFIGGLIEIKDFFFYGKGVSLRIPVSIKPTLERITKKGTLPAVILLGIIVALVELPCTGGIYLAILSLMHINKTFGIPYLLLYNLIYVLPLIVMVLIAYFGTKTEKITSWVEENKKWMRLAAGIVMIVLALYLLNSVYRFV